ncbi:glycosyltransferase [Mucilaginibacter glaciei]|uniref:Streptomycin biosynthesis protein StrF domain-containing protein n=1 Tax=Mucilaginibacter glaciei TaxID=2772109 RepID=A0A926NP86_9SPHI|nr:glycosyltransferase [Mucilaginibacter glaciei]MBD1392883.1 hypothetical protein [Mucilaginibacter glaciei]
MISVIICSINPALLKAVTYNINTTIGVPYELIAIDNRGSKKGICQVYNEASEKAQYEVLCFVHEDIIIKTNNWGSVLLNLFKDPSLGLVGVAGSSYRPLTPSKWGGFTENTVYGNIIQVFKHDQKKDFHLNRNPGNDKLKTVACVDGVWLCTTKKIAAEIKFDENTFKGFHCYDIDISLSIGCKYKVAVTYEILIKHFSEGHFDRTWMVENLKLFSKWNHILPYSIEKKLTHDVVLREEKVTFKNFIDKMISYKFPMSTVYNVLWKNNRFFKLNPALFFKMNYYIFKKYSKQKSPGLY